MKISPLFIRRATPFLLALGTVGQTPSFAADPIEGFKNTPIIPGTPYHLHDPDRPQPPVVNPSTPFSQATSAPSDATILFDGTNLDRWQARNGGPATWKVTDGYVETAPRGGAIRTKGKWEDFQLHVEWASPSPGKGRGQGRGNSGILINGMYEVQVLDSYQSKTYADGQAASIYGQAPPLVNASRAPGEWQTYDIIFESPRWDETGKQLKKAVITVLHNGVVVHHRYKLSGSTDGISREVPWRTLSKYTPHDPDVFVGLQDHGNPVRYRNIWIRPIGQYDK